MSTLKFLQFSDLAGITTWRKHLARLSEEAIESYRAGTLHALEHLDKIAREENADVLFCLGNLWDEGDLGEKEAREVLSRLDALAPRPVIIVPGAGDPFHPFSCYSAPFCETWLGISLPPNCVVANGSADGFTLPQIPGVRLYVSSSPAEELSRSGQEDELQIHLCPDNSGESATRGLGRGDYEAVGMRLSGDPVCDATGKIRLASSAPARSEEAFPLYSAVVAISEKGGVSPSSFRRVSLGEAWMRFVTVDLPPGPVSQDQLRDAVQEKIRASGAVSPDLVVLRFAGTLPVLVSDTAPAPMKQPDITGLCVVAEEVGLNCLYIGQEDRESGSKLARLLEKQLNLSTGNNQVARIGAAVAGAGRVVIASVD